MLIKSRNLLRLEENIDMWKNYELSSENLSSWLKDIEEKVRQVTGAQVNLQTFDICKILT